jgi:RNA polymerase sigma factor (sigma-70 family)
MGSRTASEAELLQASLAGSRQAFGAIVEKYQGLVCGITYSATGNRPRSEELAQETFVRAWSQLRQLRDLGSFRAWLCTIARNAARKSMIKQGRDAADLAQPLEGSQEIESIEPGPVEHAISKEQEAVVWASFREIPETYREPLVLFYRQQQSVSQVAAELDVSEDVVKQRLSRGRKLLRAELASVVEDVIEKTRPGKVFTLAVIAALPSIVPQVASAAIAGMAAKGSGAAKSAAALGFVGAALGPLLGLLGSIIAIRASIINTKSPREHEFMKKRACLAALYCFGGIAIILLLCWTVPWLRSSRWLMLALFAIFFTGVLFLGYITERKRKAIQIEDGTYIKPSRRTRTNGQIYGSFAGAIFGSLLWVHLLSVNAKDWLAVWLVLLAGVLIFVVATRMCLRNRQHYDRIAAGTFAVIGLVTLLVVNLRWDKWMSVLGDKPKYRNLSLWHMNSIIGAVIAVLILMFLLFDLRQRKKMQSQKDKPEYGDV